MRDALRLLAFSVVAFGVGVQGCTDSASTHDHSAGSAHDHDHDHDHGHDHASDGESHSAGDHDGDGESHSAGDHDAHEGHDHGSEASITGEAMAAGTTIAFAMSGEMKPNAELHVELEQIGGPAIAAVRLWAGAKSGVGSMKTKADATGSDGKHYHAHVAVPAEVTEDTALHIEVETKDGKTGVISIKVT